MPNNYFQFKQFRIEQEKNAMKVTTDACVFGSICDFSNSTNLLDIGAGTGVLSLMLAQRYPKTRISSVEIDFEAFKELSNNIQASIFSNRVSPIHFDIIDFANNSNFKNSFDGIISNPPFFKADLHSTIETKNRVRHEEQCLSMTDLLNAVEKLLSPNGVFYSLYPTKRIEEYKEKLKTKGLVIENLTFLSNNNISSPHLFIARSKREGKTSLNYTESLFYIREKNIYSQEMRELMKEFYLK